MPKMHWRSGLFPLGASTPQCKILASGCVDSELWHNWGQKNTRLVLPYRPLWLKARTF